MKNILKSIQRSIDGVEMLDNTQNSIEHQSISSLVLTQINLKTGLVYSLENLKEELNIVYYILTSLDKKYKIFSSDRKIKEYITHLLLEKLEINVQDGNIELSQLMDWFRPSQEINPRSIEIESTNELFSELHRITTILFHKRSARKSLGIYYSPPELVQFMVKASIFLMIKNNISETLNVFDFAAGYSIFPSVFMNYLKNQTEYPLKIKDILCFDVLFSAVIISEYISTYILNGHPKFQIKLDNVLSENFENKIACESRFPVILGNPPYSGHSKWNNYWTEKLIKPFQYEFENKILQKKWLHDDYVKFFGLAFQCIEEAGKGLICFVTNNNYLDGDAFISFRKVVAHLFHKIYVLNLGGSKRRKKALEKEMQDKDENLFNINQGISVFLALRLSENGSVKADHTETEIFYHEICGSFEQKIKFLTTNTLESIPWKSIPLNNVPKTLIPFSDNNIFNRYESFIRLNDLLKMKNNRKIHTGIKTLHDEFAIGFSRQDIIKKVELFLNTHSESEARSLFTLCRQTQWNYETAKKTLSALSWKELIIPILYRPFDIRYTVYHDAVCKFRKPETSDLLLKENSIALLISRKVKSNSFAHVFVSAYPTEVIALSPQTSCNVYVFPVISDSMNLVDLQNANQYFSHLGISFSESFPQLNGNSNTKYTAMDLLGWIYAILYSENYRKMYSDFLCSDFPRIPLPKDRKTFDDVSKSGKNLINLHLNRNVNLSTGCQTDPDFHKNHIKEFREPFKITKIQFKHDDNLLILNENISLDSITKDIWDYRIGDHQPLKSYLKYRKSHNWPLSIEDLNCIMYIASIIKETLVIQQKIDDFLDLR